MHWNSPQHPGSFQHPQALPEQNFWNSDAASSKAFLPPSSKVLEGPAGQKVMPMLFIQEKGLKQTRAQPHHCFSSTEPFLDTFAPSDAPMETGQGGSWAVTHQSVIRGHGQL